MKSKLVLLAIGLLVANKTAIFAQSRTEKKIEKVGEDIDKADETLEKGKNLLDLFKKKKNKQDEEGLTHGETDPSVTGQEPNKGNEVQNPMPESKKKVEKEADSIAQDSNKLKPGDIHPDAVMLDVDGMESFNGGAARVTKGNATALIDSKGGFLIPFNKYWFTPMFDPRSQNGIFVTSEYVVGQAEAKNHLGFANSEGKIITLQKPFVGLGHDVGGYFLQEATGGGNLIRYFYDKTGKMFSITNFDGSDINKGVNSWGYRQLGPLFLYLEQNSKYGFRDKNDRIIVKPQWDRAENFTEGAALVGQKNEFGEIKYGFIDTSGEVIVPLKYSKKPESFSDGLAKVVSNERVGNTYQYYYGYIDKSGELVINSKNFESPGMLFSSFYHGYAFNYKQVLNKEGVIFSSNVFLRDHGIPEEIIGTNDIEYKPNNVGNGKMLVSFKGNQTDRRKKYFALLDLINKRTLFYWYADVNIDYFDSISGLAHVIEYGDKARADFKREGFINEEGIFMMVKGEAIKW